MTTMPTRRALLTLAGTAIGSTAGCLSHIPGVTDSESNDHSFGIDFLAVKNLDDVQHQVTVVIDDGDGTEVFREKYALDPETADGLDTPVDGKDDYTIRATAGTSTVRELSAIHIGQDVRCIGAIVRIRTDGEMVIRSRTYDRCADDEGTA
jgi:hypothetical protein